MPQNSDILILREYFTRQRNLKPRQVKDHRFWQIILSAITGQEIFALWLAFYSIKNYLKTMCKFRRTCSAKIQSSDAMALHIITKYKVYLKKTAFTSRKGYWALHGWLPRDKRYWQPDLPDKNRVIHNIVKHKLHSTKKNIKKFFIFKALEHCACRQRFMMDWRAGTPLFLEAFCFVS